MTNWLLVYDPVTIHLFVGSIQIKIQFARDEQDLNHWLCKCPAGDAIRQQVSGNHKGFLEWLATRSGNMVAYAKKTLVSFDA